MKIELESVSLDAALDPIRKAFEPIAAEKGIEFRVDAGSNSPETLTTDVRRLQQILRNLLSNALKFTTKGSVELRVRPAQRGCIAFEVEDTGIGIPEDQLALIFEAFHQADGTTSRKYGGTGLGLSISRELARLLGRFDRGAEHGRSGQRFHAHDSGRAGCVGGQGTRTSRRSPGA